MARIVYFRPPSRPVINARREAIYEIERALIIRNKTLFLILRAFDIRQISVWKNDETRISIVSEY